LLIVSALASYYLRSKKITFIQDAPLITFIGMSSGFLLKFCGYDKDLNIIVSAFPNIFFLVLIPPIIFHSSYVINKVFFRGVLKK